MNQIITTTDKDRKMWALHVVENIDSNDSQITVPYNNAKIREQIHMTLSALFKIMKTIYRANIHKAFEETYIPKNAYL